VFGKHAIREFKRDCLGKRLLPTELPQSKGGTYFRRVWDQWWRERMNSLMRVAKHDVGGFTACVRQTIRNAAGSGFELSAVNGSLVAKLENGAFGVPNPEL